MQPTPGNSSKRAKAIADWMDGDKEMHVPIRFDQTCSGMGIIACLTRDRELARLTNCIGDRRGDVYEQVAEDLTLSLRRDLEGFDFGAARLAEIWLKHGISTRGHQRPVHDIDLWRTVFRDR